MNRTRNLLEAMADLLTKAVPLERERMVQRPYRTDYGTRLEFRERSPSETKYQPGNWTESERAPVRPVLSGQYPTVMDELREKQEASPTAWLHSARGAVLTYAADFWWEYGLWIKLAAPSEGFAGWPLDLPAGQRLVVRSDIFRDGDAWLGWGRCAADFPRLVNDAAVKAWIVSEAASSKKRPRVSKDEANRRAGDALKGRPPSGKRWTIRTLASAIGCSDGLVPKLPEWQVYSQERGLTNASKQRAPKAVGFTRAVEATQGQEDPELVRLIAEQTDEDEADQRQYRRRKKV